MSVGGLTMFGLNPEINEKLLSTPTEVFLSPV